MSLLRKIFGTNQYTEEPKTEEESCLQTEQTVQKRLSSPYEKLEGYCHSCGTPRNIGKYLNQLFPDKKISEITAEDLIDTELPCASLRCNEFIAVDEIVRAYRDKKELEEKELEEKRQTLKREEKIRSQLYRKEQNLVEIVSNDSLSDNAREKALYSITDESCIYEAVSENGDLSDVIVAKAITKITDNEYLLAIVNNSDFSDGIREDTILRLTDYDCLNEAIAENDDLSEEVLEKAVENLTNLLTH